MTREGIHADALSVLYDPTPDDEVKKRQGPRQHQGDCPKFGACPQAHLMLDYIDARYVMDKLDRLGPENWQDQFVDRDGGSVRCGIGLLIDGEWVWKWDVGTVSDIEPEKGSYSEAFKRAAVKWGVGRDLYGHKPAKAQPPATAPRPAPVARPEPILGFVNSDPNRPLDHEPPDPNVPREPSASELAALFDTEVATQSAALRPPRQTVPTCPTHLWDDAPRPMKPDTRASHPGEYHCTAKVGDGYCQERWGPR
jgi:hypothetical protein